MSETPLLGEVQANSRFAIPKAKRTNLFRYNDYSWTEQPILPNSSILTEGGSVPIGVWKRLVRKDKDWLGGGGKKKRDPEP
jgi:hypothetical protein